MTLGADFWVSGGGSVYLLTPCTSRAYDWADENVAVSVVGVGESIPVGHGYIEDICRGALADGLTIAKDGALMAFSDDELVLEVA